MTKSEIKSAAAQAAQLAATALLDLLSITRFGDGQAGERDAAEAEGRLLRAIKLTMEIAGFHPDETERAQLYRAIADYITALGED